MIRDFARHIVSIRAANRNRAVALEKLDKHTWRAAARRRVLDGERRSVRVGPVGARRASRHQTRILQRSLRVPARSRQESAPCELEIVRPGGARYRNWRIGTAMARKGAKPYGFGAYVASDYDELIDHPVEMGEFTLASFRAGGVPHDIAITGRHAADARRLQRDLQRLCEHHMRFLRQACADEALRILVTAVGEGYGGLEHRASTALLCSRDDLPREGMIEVSEPLTALSSVSSATNIFTPGT